MPANQKTQEKRVRDIQRITNRAQTSANRTFDGDTPKEFLYWAMDLHLDQAENQPTVDELLGNITDGKDDLELDAYYIDDDARTIYLFQSKFRSNPGNLKMAELANFLEVPNTLSSPQILAGISNERILDFAPAFRRTILDGYELQLVYVTTLRATKNLDARALAWSHSTLILNIGGEDVDVPHSADVLDIDHLIRVIDSLDENREIELTLEIDPSGYHQSSSGGFRCLTADLPLEELAKIFDEFKYAIFKYNPRGPLGAVAVNKEIKATLENQERRTRFQLMNNGLSAVCTSFDVSETDGVVSAVSVHDFQIVNGCQTTYSVYDHWRRGGELGDATVTLKLVEDPSSLLNQEISATSNKQSQMKDWDFLFGDSEQVRLHNEFADLEPPLFYELRRGQHKYIAGNPKAKRVTVKDIAQTMWAFIGFPGEAKDKLREVPRSKLTQKGTYEQVFTPKVEAERLRLPWLVYEKVQDEWKTYAESTEKRSDEREHGRLHILWLIGRSVVKALGCSTYQELPISKVEHLRATLEEWFPAHHKIAVDTINYVVDVQQEVAQKAGEQLQLRPLFRSSEHYEDFKKRHDKLFNDNQDDLIGLEWPTNG